MQLARRHKAIAAIVAFAADRADRVEVEMLLREFRHGRARIFHQGERRNAIFLSGSAVNGAHLFRGDDFHERGAEALAARDSSLTSCAVSPMAIRQSSAPDGFMGFRVEASVAVRVADGQDHDAEFMVNAGTANGRPGKRGLRRDADFFDQHLEGAGAVTGDIEEIQQVRAQKTLGNAMARGSVRRDHDIGPGGFQVLLRAPLHWRGQ